MSFLIRKIKESDNDPVVAIVKSVMTEFGANPATTILGDPRLLKMYWNYQEPRSVYFVAEENGKILGGSGIKKLDNGDEDTCELQRMFLLPEARGKGIGKALMQNCVQAAKEFEFKKIYIESLSNMHDAINLYERFGFRRIAKPMGDTGHAGCDVNMMMEI